MPRPAPLPPLLLLVATILTVATGCDKANGALGKADSALDKASGTIDLAKREVTRREVVDVEPPAAEQLDLSRRPLILFQVFGAHDDPRMIPVAAVVGGNPQQIVLSSANWRAFDTLYTRAGATVTLHRDGAPAGTARVRRSMWENGAPLYSLPGCRRLTPLAAVSAEGIPAREYTLDYLAATAPLGGSHPGVRVVRGGDAARVARTVGEVVGKERGITRAMLAGLDHRTVAVPTGTTPQPTLVTAFAPPPAFSASGSETQTTTHVFALADARPDGYAITYRHAVHGPAAETEFRRYVDHLDLNGDGVDEIMLEAWRPRAESRLLILAFREGEWREVFRSRGGWCLDAAADSAVGEK